MLQKLRKGQSGVYLQYELGGDSIGADNFEVESQGAIAVIRFRLHPVDSNQRSDERRLHSELLTEVQISDGYILDKLATFMSSSHVNAESLALEITSLGKTLRFSVEFGATGLGFLPLVVQRDAS